MVSISAGGDVVPGQWAVDKRDKAPKKYMVKHVMDTAVNGGWCELETIQDRQQDIENALGLV